MKFNLDENDPIIKHSPERNTDNDRKNRGEQSATRKPHPLVYIKWILNGFTNLAEVIYTCSELRLECRLVCSSSF